MIQVPWESLEIGWCIPRVPHGHSIVSGLNLAGDRVVIEHSGPLKAFRLNRRPKEHDDDLDP